MKKLLIAIALLAGCATTDTGRSPVQSSRTGAGPTQAELVAAERHTGSLGYG